MSRSDRSLALALAQGTQYQSLVQQRHLNQLPFRRARTLAAVS